jgi:hypothetical protein
MTTARENVREDLLVEALADYVDISTVDSHVTRQNPSASVSEVQNETLETVRSLVSDGLFVLGAMSGKDGRWEAWDAPLDASMQKISELYVTRYDDPPAWVWSTWMELTDKGRQAARELEEISKDSRT